MNSIEEITGRVQSLGFELKRTIKHNRRGDKARVYEYWIALPTEGQECFDMDPVEISHLMWRLKKAQKILSELEAA